jgi:hypothetical protein
MRWLTLLLFAAALPACNCTGETPDSQHKDSGSSCSCPDAQTCAPVTGACVAALEEGALCEQAPDGGVAEGACVDGLACGYVGSAKRCSRECTKANEPALCGATRTCLARPNTAGSTSGYCAATSSEGGECDDAKLTKCAGKTLVCLSPASSTAGHCYRYCDSTLSDPNPNCAASASCADLFPGDTSGVCVVPVGHYPTACDYSTMKFCARTEVCARYSYESPLGFCHLRCEKGADCSGGQECAEPSTGLKICVSPVARCTEYDPARCQGCEPRLDQYCGPADICVTLPGGDGGSVTACKQDCTGGGACAYGLCQPLQGTTRSVCL